ncbi:hypothetical protein DH2020_041831 [Rehmannia glutinosa]|uniref:Uncharacterized protein n=1 Tax=Rehmannia glutinosa TaxID=99300 RepID=A0ABR0UQ50_REHGL
MVFPASAIVFALGFSVGLVKGGHSKELRLNVNRQKVVEDNFRGFIEKLRNLGNNLKGYNADVLNLKNGIKRSIESNHVTVSDLEGYVAVIQSVDISLRNTIDLVESCIQSILGGNLENEGGSDLDSGRRRKKSGDNGLNFSRYFDGLFGRKFDGPKPGKVESMDVEERKNKKQANILAAPVEKGNLYSTLNEDLVNKSASVLDNPFDTTVRARNRAENFVDGTGMENIAVENDKRNVTETNDIAKAVFDQTIYNYRNKTSKFVNNEQVCLDDYQDDVETMSSHHNSSYNSVDVSISMNHRAASFGHQQKRESMKRNYSYLENTEEDQQEYHKYSYTKGTFSSKKRPPFANQESAQENAFGNDIEFNRYLSEANNLLKEAKGCLTKQVDDGRTEHALRKSATLLSKAIDMRPMSLLAVGQLGNTYLLHGELKLRMSRELRSLLVRTDPFSDEEWGEILNRFDDQLANKDKITSALVNVCEECEELLIKAGRKYKLALSIDGNDMRALYNWGLALTFRAQLIADIGPSAARDADKVFLAAIDKFDAMMSKSNAYAPDALFRWGAALQQRSRLRPSRSREKVKLLQQARRLYEDALHMDSGSRPVREALSSCISELRLLV